MKREIKPIYLFLFFALLYVIPALLRHWLLLSNGQDLGLEVNLIYNIKHSVFEIPMLSDRGGHFFAHHFNAVLLILSRLPDFLITPYFLLMLQAIAVASAIFPLVWIGESISLRKEEKLFLTVFLFSNYYLARAILYDFHPELFFVPLSIWIIWAIHREKWGLVWVFSLIAWTLKEDIPLIIAWVAIYYVFVFRKKEKKLNFPLFLLAIFSFIIFLGEIWYMNLIASIRGNGSISGSVSLSQYLWIGRGEFLSSLFERIWYVLKYLLSFLFLPVRYLLPYPAILEMFLRANKEAYSFGLHYSYSSMGLLMVSSLYGAKTFFQRWRIKNWLLIIIALLNLTFFINKEVRILKGGSFSRAYFFHTKVKGLVDNRSPVLAQQNLVAHFAQRERVLDLGHKGWKRFLAREAKWLILDLQGNTWPMKRAEYSRFLKKISSRKMWKVLIKERNFIVYKKMSTH